MRTKRFSVILIAIAFMFVVVFSCVGLFSVKKVHVSFAVAEETNAEEIQSALDGFVGDNLLFLKTSEVEKLLKSFHYMEVLAAEKQYPNVLNIQLKERREVYYIEYQNDYFITTEDGFVLKALSATEFSGQTSRDKILLKLDGVNVLKADVGDFVQTDNDIIMQSVFEMAKSVNLTDCIKNVTIQKVADISGEGIYDVFFNTYTGVSMRVEGIDNATEKAKNAFFVYDDILTDYQKACGTIESYLMNDGRYRVTYNQTDVWTSGN